MDDVTSEAADVLTFQYLANDNVVNVQNVTASTTQGPDDGGGETGRANDSAMMIAWERALESKRPDALFVDPLAEALAGTKGETLSAGFGNMSQMFGFEDWAAFHKTWVAVRTRFIDDRVKECACGFKQLVNLGAGMDTRPYRLECYKAFANGSFNVDMKVVNDGKARIFERVLQAHNNK